MQLEGHVRRPEDQSGATATPGVIVCVDWSVRHKKRASFAASVSTRRVAKLPPVEPTVTGFLREAERLHSTASVLVAFDAPIGIPKALFGRLCAARSASLNFIDWLPHALSSQFTQPVSIAADWSEERPFFNVGKRKGGRKAFEDRAASLRVALRREIEECTGATSVFALGVPSQVGRGACALWKELQDARAGQMTFSVWPFEGELKDLCSKPGLVVGEMYPRAAYQHALSEEGNMVPASLGIILLPVDGCEPTPFG